MAKQALAKAKSEPQAIQMIQQLEQSGQLRAALPEIGVTPERMARIAITAIRQTPGLGKCHPLSVVSAVVEMAQLGLMPNTPLGHAYMIPFKSTATVVIGYKGFVALAYRAGVLLNADVVYEKDITHGTFEWRKGTNENVVHVPYQGDEESGKIVYGYAVAKFPKLGDTATLTKVIDKAEIQRAIQSSATGAKTVDGQQKIVTPWYWRKTAIRRLAPLLPLTTEFARAVELDEQADEGRMQNMQWQPPSLTSAQDADTMGSKLAEAKAEEAETTDQVACTSCGQMFPEAWREGDADLCPECVKGEN